MKKGNQRSICYLLLEASSIVLASCGSSGSSASYASKYLSVSYYDDTPVTPVLIGHSYVMPNANAMTMGHLDKYEDGSLFDYTSRSKKAPSKVGAYWAFKDFEGTYDDEAKTAVDLTKVTADCKVYAKFEEKDYTYDIAYYNDDQAKTSSQTGLKWGDQVTYPSLASYQQVNYRDPASTPNGDWGRDYVNPTDAKKTTPDFYCDGDASSKTLPSQWAFDSGESLPNTASAVGTLFATTALDDANQCNRTYKMYLSNGTDWLSLGSLASGLTIKLRALYQALAHPFIVTFYDAKPTSGTPSHVLGTLAVPYNNVFTLSADGTTVSASYGTTTMAPFASTHKSWEGFYTNCAGQKLYENKIVSELRVMADCSFYPID